MKQLDAMAETTRVDAKALIEHVIACDAIEIVDSATGWRLLHEVLDGDPAADDRVLVFARGAGDGAPRRDGDPDRADRCARRRRSILRARRRRLGGAKARTCAPARESARPA